MTITWNSSKPANPVYGDVYTDSSTFYSYVWLGQNWTIFSANEKPEEVFTVPTEEQLNKHPALKNAWEEFLVIKRLLGV